MHFKFYWEIILFFGREVFELQEAIRIKDAEGEAYITEIEVKATYMLFNLVFINHTLTYFYPFMYRQLVKHMKICRLRISIFSNRLLIETITISRFVETPPYHFLFREKRSPRTSWTMVQFETTTRTSITNIKWPEQSVFVACNPLWRFCSDGFMWFL